jgi:hypothetical protein
MWKPIAIAAAAMALTGLLGLAILDLIRPDVPEADEALTHAGTARKCLADVAGHYRPEYLTYGGHARAWLYGVTDTLDMSLDADERAYLTDYSRLHEAVDCYILSSGDTRLNMGLSAPEFQAVYRSLASGHAIESRL